MYDKSVRLIRGLFRCNCDNTLLQSRQIRSDTGDFCLTAPVGGGDVRIESCNTASIQQQWTIDNYTEALRPAST